MLTLRCSPHRRSPLKHSLKDSFEDAYLENACFEHTQPEDTCLKHAQLKTFFHQQQLMKKCCCVEDCLHHERCRFETNQCIMMKAQNSSNDSNFVLKGQKEEREGDAKLDSDDELYLDEP